MNKNSASIQTQPGGSLFLQSQMLFLPGLFLQGERNLPEGVGPGGLKDGGGALPALLPVTVSRRGSAAAPSPNSRGGRAALRPRPGPAGPRRTCTMMAMRSESLGILSLHFLQEARPLLAYSTR